MNMINAMWESQRLVLISLSTFEGATSLFHSRDSQLIYAENYKNLRFTIGNGKKYHRKNNTII